MAKARWKIARPLHEYGHVNRGRTIIGGKVVNYRSGWEHERALQLESMKAAKLIADWKHEPVRFEFPDEKVGAKVYTIDFWILMPDGSHYWEEVKGRVTSDARTKARRMAKYYPDEKIYYLRKRKGKFERFEILPKKKPKS